MPKVTSKKKTKTAEPVIERVEREIEYPEVTVVVCTEATGGSVTVELAKEYLGWQEETEDVKFGPDYLFTDLNGKKIRCTKNTRNRPFYEKHCVAIAQDHLNRRWRLNGETIVIGKYGEVISGQHRLISLVLAEQTRQQDVEGWADKWSDEVTMDTIIVFGVDESDDVVNTCDVGKTRSLVDVLYRSKWFETLAPKDRKAGARAADYAVRLVWDRTGAGDDAYAPTRTHAESMDFFERHPTLIPGCVKHIVEENGKNNAIGKYIAPGSASGLCFLMAASNSDPDAYRDNRSEDVLDMTLLSKAQDFWVGLHGGDNALTALRDGILAQADPDTLENGATFPERLAMIVKAWNAYSQGAKITPATVKLRYDTADDGTRILAETPLLGGIDIAKKADDAVGEESAADEDVTVEQAAKAAADIREKKGDKAPITPKKNDDLINQLADLRKAHPGRVLYFEIGDQYRLFTEDADLAVKHLGVKLDAKQTVGGLQTVSFKKSNLVPSHTAFNEAGLSIATVTKSGDDDFKVTPMAPIAKKKKK